MKEITLQLSATPTTEGFDILAINAGEAKGHGITFGRDVLMQAVPMYEGLPVFIDHYQPGGMPSVRNLAGTINMPAWSEEHQGITAKLKASGPAKQVLLDLREAAMSDKAIMQAVGFSSIVYVQLDKRNNVTKIVRTKSVDAVIDPARGGKFLSAYLGQKGESIMSEETQTTNAELSENEQAAFNLQGGNEALAEVQEQAKQSKALLIEQCRMLLNTSLAASKLPAASQKAVRKPFELKLAKGEYFLATELQEAITEKREELAAIQTPANVQGPGRDVSYVGGMFTSKDQFIAAYADLLGAPRPEGLEKLQTHRLRGIQEAYLLATGDVNFYGGYYPEFALAASVNFPGVTADLLNKVLTNAWNDAEKKYGWWKKITTVEHFTNLNDVKWLKTGTIGSLPTVNERGEYTELPIGDNKESSAWYKYGGYIAITLEDMLKDNVGALRRLPKEAALGGMRNISEQIAAIFTSNSAVGPTLADGGALFNSTAVSTAGGHANLLTTALGTDYTAWKAIRAAMYKQPLLVKNATGYYNAGKRQAIEPRFILVPIELEDQANSLFIPNWSANAQNVSPVSPTFGGKVEPVVVPEWTDATDYAAVASPSDVECIMLGEMFGTAPQIFSASSEMDPAMFSNDESRIKVRQFLNVGVADYRGLHKENV